MTAEKAVFFAESKKRGKTAADPSKSELNKGKTANRMYEEDPVDASVEPDVPEDASGEEAVPSCAAGAPQRSCPCMTPCPMVHAMRMIGGKWKVPILCTLYLGGALRYNELVRRIDGITSTMMASSLRELERDGLVQRIQYNEMPVRVEYSLTDACSRLMPALEVIVDWSKDMMQTAEEGR